MCVYNDDDDDDDDDYDYDEAGDTGKWEKHYCASLNQLFILMPHGMNI